MKIQLNYQSLANEFTLGPIACATLFSWIKQKPFSYQTWAVLCIMNDDQQMGKMDWLCGN